jgi:hypothetical protein
MSPTSADTATVSVQFAIAASAPPTVDQKVQLQVVIANQINVPMSALVGFTVASTAARRRLQSGYLWTVSFDLVTSLAAAGEATSGGVASSVATTLAGTAFQAAVTSGVPGSALTVDAASIATAAFTRSPSSRPNTDPTVFPTFEPTSKPSSEPTSKPAFKPTLKPVAKVAKEGSGGHGSGKFGGLSAASLGLYGGVAAGVLFVLVAGAVAARRLAVGAKGAGNNDDDDADAAASRLSTNASLRSSVDNSRSAAPPKGNGNEASVELGPMFSNPVIAGGFGAGGWKFGDAAASKEVAVTENPHMAALRKLSKPRVDGGAGAGALPAAAAPACPLPSGWAHHSMPDGKAYYANAATGESSWSVPGGRATDI